MRLSRKSRAHSNHHVCMEFDIITQCTCVGLKIVWIKVFSVQTATILMRPENYNNNLYKVYCTINFEAVGGCVVVHTHNTAASSKHLRAIFWFHWLHCCGEEEREGGRERERECVSESKLPAIIINFHFNKHNGPMLDKAHTHKHTYMHV